MTTSGNDADVGTGAVLLFVTAHDAHVQGSGSIGAAPGTDPRAQGSVDVDRQCGYPQRNTLPSGSDFSSVTTQSREAAVLSK
tara:strand:+ start:1451 stop:1696 length:246 start_codon:yes stop_codon:yes gene_type:complete